MVIWERAFADGEPDADLALGAAGGAAELEGAEAGGIVRVNQVLESESEGSDKGFGDLGGFGVEDFEGEERVLERKREGDEKVLVPDGAGGGGVVGLGGETVVRVDPEDGVGFEVALTPVHVLQVLGGDDRDVEVERLRWRTRGCHWRRR